MTSTAPALIELDNVSFAWRRGGRRVLDGLSLRVEAGEFLALAGPNGCGKSTLLRLISGLLRPEAGRALIDGRLAAEMTRAEIGRRIATVPQTETAIFPFTVREAVLMGRTPHLRGLLASETKDDRAAAEQALADAGISDLAERPLTALSGGERQLVLVARALAQDAPVLLLDEPTAALDLAHQQDVLRLLRRLNEAGRTILMVAHDLNLGAMFCGRMAVMHGGRIAADGAPDDIITEDNLRRIWGADVWLDRSPEGSVSVGLRR